MKKGLCILLSAALIVFSFASCGKKGATDEQETKVDESGNAYVVYKDKDGKEVTSVLSDKEKKDAEKKTTKKNDSEKKTTKVSDSEAISKIENGMSGLADMDENDMKSDKKDLAPDGTKINKTTLRDDVILNSIKGGKITLKMKLKAASQEEIPVKLVCNDKKIAADMTMKGSTVRMIIEESGAYIVMPSLKMYMKMSSDEVGNLDEFKNLANTNDTYVSSSKVKQNGVEYTCEEFKSSDGTITKYYFNSKKEWKRMEAISGDEVAIYEIESFSNTADESMFSLKGYTDMTALLNSQIGETA